MYMSEKLISSYFRVLKSKGMSVSDASAVWFLSVLGATASATMPMAPHLRDVILSHTRYSTLYCPYSNSIIN